MRILLLIGGVLGASAMAMANSPEIPIANQPTVHHQANVNCCNHVYVTYRDPVVRTTTPVVRTTTPVVRTTTQTRAQQPVRYITTQAPVVHVPTGTVAPPPVRYEAYPRVDNGNRYQSRRHIHIDASRFPRFQSWTSM